MENFQRTGSVSNAHVGMEQTWATMTWPVLEGRTHKVLLKAFEKKENEKSPGVRTQ